MNTDQLVSSNPLYSSARVKSTCIKFTYIQVTKYKAQLELNHFSVTVKPLCMSLARVKFTSRQFSYIQVTPRQLHYPVYTQLESSPPVYSSNSQIALARVISTLKIC